MAVRYVGSGPYCYANSVAMIMADAIDPGLVEVLTGSPFGMQLVGGTVPLFDPLGWDPGIGIDAALDLLGWECAWSDGGDAATAVGRLRNALADGPVLVGPMEIGLLSHHPEARGPIGSDHFVVVLGCERDVVRFHDPHGYPFATLPAEAFAGAWRGESIPYTDREYIMRSSFRRIREVDAPDALRAALPAAIAWLDGRPDLVPPGSLGSGDAASALADMVDAGLADDQRELLVWFAIRLGARRLCDAEYWLRQVDLDQAADIAAAQSRLVASLQHPLIAGDSAAAASSLRELAPTYRELSQALQTAGFTGTSG